MDSAASSVASSADQPGLSDFIRFLFEEHLKLLVHETNVIAAENSRLRVALINDPTEALREQNRILRQNVRRRSAA